MAINEVYKNIETTIEIPEKKRIDNRENYGLITNTK